MIYKYNMSFIGINVSLLGFFLYIHKLAKPAKTYSRYGATLSFIWSCVSYHRMNVGIIFTVFALFLVPSHSRGKYLAA